jgi:hypothetical protein
MCIGIQPDDAGSAGSADRARLAYDVRIDIVLTSFPPRTSAAAAGTGATDVPQDTTTLCEIWGELNCGQPLLLQIALVSALLRAPPHCLCHPHGHIYSDHAPLVARLIMSRAPAPATGPPSNLHPALRLKDSRSPSESIYNGVLKKHMPTDTHPEKEQQGELVRRFSAACAEPATVALSPLLSPTTMSCAVTAPPRSHKRCGEYIDLTHSTSPTQQHKRPSHFAGDFSIN